MDIPWSQHCFHIANLSIFWRVGQNFVTQILGMGIRCTQDQTPYHIGILATHIHIHHACSMPAACTVFFLILEKKTNLPPLQCIPFVQSYHPTSSIVFAKQAFDIKDWSRGSISLYVSFTSPQSFHKAVFLAILDSQRWQYGHWWNGTLKTRYHNVQHH